MTARFLTAVDVAGLTGFHRVTVLRMAREGRIPAVKVGRSVRFEATAIDKWFSTLPKASA